MNNINKITLFSDSIISYEDNNEWLNKTILEELSSAKENNKERTISNVGGYQVPGTNDKVFTFLAEKIGKCLQQFYPLHNIQLSLDEYWINENKKNNYNRLHIHPGSQFSGVYYVNAPENCGSIKFIRNDISSQYLGLIEFFKDSDSYINYTFIPYQGLMIIFPSNLQHEVEPNLSDLPRISIAFNISLKKTND